MDRRRFLQIAGAAALAPAVGAAPAKRPPNVVLVLIDDLGWRDLGCYGSDFYETPRIDALAAEGVRFTQFYAASPVCSPTRASIMSGQDPARLHLTHYIPGLNPQDRRLLVPDWRKYFPLETTTVAEAFQDAGYVTGMVGKWHLGAPAGSEYRPDKQGFDWVRRHGPGGGDKFVSSYTDAALGFIREHRDDPFFLYLPHHTVHVPFEAPEDLIGKYRGKPPGESGQNNPVMAAMIEALDRGTGRLLDGLEEMGLADNTIVLFTSDNGGLRYVLDEETGQVVTATNNAPLRGGKAQLYEGGIRVPFIARWPRGLPAGVLEPSPAISNDIFPSLLALAGLPLRPGAHKDGLDVLSRLATDPPALQPPAHRDALFWHFPHYQAGTRPSGAVRQGDMKLIECYEDGAAELYDLAGDMGEEHNLAQERPGVAQELRALLHARLEAIGAQMPAPNPNYAGTATG